MTTENPPKRPPNDRGQGRKPIKPGERMVVVPLRMTPEQKAKLTTLGGAKWVRDKLDEMPPRTDWGFHLQKDLCSLNYALTMEPCRRKRLHHPGGTRNPDRSNIMKYQLADLNNGPFGDVYDTITDAEAALAEIVKDSLAQAKEEILLQEDEDAEREYREPKVFNDEELAEKAEERIREFHSIVEINDEAEAEAEAEHRSASIIHTVNAAGLAEIAAFLADNHVKGGDHFTADMLGAWAADAEFSLAEGNGAVIELAARDSIHGRTQTFEISAAGLDSQNVEIGE